MRHESRETCPYCRENNGLFDEDHVFPQFLGGRATIRVCKKCNSNFGSSFEGTVSMDLAPYAVILARGGIKPVRPAVFPNAIVDENGDSWDLNSEGEGWLSKPKISRAGDGSIELAQFRTKQEADSLLRHLRGSTEAKYAVRWEGKQVPVGGLPFRFSFELGSEIRRLVVKMCLGVVTQAKLLENPQFINARNFLLGVAVDDVPVFFDFRNLLLDRMRPSLAHCIYVETNPNATRTYGVVQFYGTIQFYCALGFESGSSLRGVLSLLDPVNRTEDSKEVTPPLRAVPAPKLVSQSQCTNGLKNWAEKFGKQLTERTGKELSSTIDLAHPLTP